MNRQRWSRLVAGLTLCLAFACGAPVLAASPSAMPSAIPSAGPSSGPVQPRFGIGAGPSQLVLGATDQTATFTISNVSDVEVTITITVHDFLIDSSGKRVASAQPLPIGLAGWLTFDPPTFNLAPKGSRQVKLTVNRPTDASPGDHYTVVEAGGTVSDTVWKQFVAQTGGTAMMRSRIAFPVTVVTRVPGAIDSTLEADVTVPSPIFTWDQDYTLTPGIVDKGNVAASWLPAAGATGAPETLIPSLRLSNGIGFLGGDALLYGKNNDGTLAPLLVLPGATKRQSLVLKDVPIVGSYDYTYALPAKASDNRAAITATGHFWIVNLRKVLLWIVLPLVLLLLLLVTWRVLRKRARTRLELERAQLRREIEAEVRGEGLR